MFPRGDRAPAIAPISRAALDRHFDDHPDLRSWRIARASRVDSGFYISQALEATRHESRQRGDRSGFLKLGPSVLPFADAATPELPMRRLLRLSLFQVTVGMAAVLLIGTLNRVMIVELSVPSWIVAGMLRCRCCLRRCAL